MSNNNSTNDHNERKGRVLELYDQGKNTREIAKELRMSLRDISIILRTNQVNHGIAITKDNGNDNNNNSNNSNKSCNEKATRAYKLFSEGTKLSDVAIELGLREKEASKLFGEFLRLKGQQEIHEIYLDDKYYFKSLLWILLHQVAFLLIDIRICCNTRTMISLPPLHLYYYYQFHRYGQRIFQPYLDHCALSFSVPFTIKNC